MSPFFYYFICFFFVFSVCKWLVANRLESLLFKILDSIYISTLFSSGGVLKEVLGLEDTFWSPWRWPERSSPWARSLQVLKNALSSAEDSTVFWIVKNGPWSWLFLRHLEERQNICKDLFFLTTSEILRKIFVSYAITFFFEEHLRVVLRIARESGPPLNRSATSENNGTKKPYFFSFSFFLATSRTRVHTYTTIIINKNIYC